MTDYREEQEGELEALRSIYPEDELKGEQKRALAARAEMLFRAR